METESEALSWLEANPNGRYYNELHRYTICGAGRSKQDWGIFVMDKLLGENYARYRYHRR